jgi:protein tyrosine/serine phosphatase
MKTAQPLRRLGVIVAVTLASLLAGCGNTSLPVGALPYNFDVLDDGRAYRSSQPTAGQLETIIDAYDIRTVLNLRGANPGDAWYDDEQAVCQARGVTLVDAGMSAKALPSPDVLRSIINTLQTADYPILIHCQGGADRTGAVSAIYRMLILGQDRAAALADLSPLHLHFRASAPCMDTLAEMYEPTPDWLAWYETNVDQIQCQ